MKTNSKLIIFDLDDCLVDTWGALIPTLIKQAIENMISAGLEINSFENAVKRLKEINDHSKNGSEAIIEFLREGKKDLSFLEIGEKGFYNFDFEYNIKPLPGVIEMFDKTKADFAIVTKGDLKYQMKKLEKAGINSKLFKKILAVPKYNKKEYYQQLLNELNYLPDDCFVCGDRYETDLLPAKELGIKTIHIPWGRGKIIPVKTGDVTHTISNLREIISIVNKD